MEVFEKDAKKKWTPRPLMFHHPATPTTPERISLQYGRRYDCANAMANVVMQPWLTYTSS